MSNARLWVYLSSALILSSCGRGALDPVGFGGSFELSDGSARGPRDGSLSVDAGARDGGGSKDTGPRWDSGSPFDAGLRRDASVGWDGSTSPDGSFQCLSSADCDWQFGPPPCPWGGSWACANAFCEAQCQPPPLCNNDCDCPSDLVCLEGSCRFANRLNNCCTNPWCPPGARCLLPSGGTSFCEGPDAGLPPDAGALDGGRRDASVAFDGGIVRDGAVRWDAGWSSDGGSSADGGIRPDSGFATPVGAACTDAPSSCRDGRCLTEPQGFPGGYCTDECGNNQPRCPPGSACRNTGGGNRLCLDSCIEPAECRPGYACIQLGLDPNKVCWPIPEGSTNPNGSPVGAACRDQETCDEGLVCLDQQSFPGGYCTLVYCDPTTHPCPTGSSCFAFPGLFSACLADCPNAGTQSTCRRGYFCLGPSGQPGVCVGN